MLDIEDQLRRYGAALERQQLDGDVAAGDPGPRWPASRTRLAVAAAALVLVVVGTAGILVRLRVDGSVVSAGSSTTIPGPPPAACAVEGERLVIVPDAVGRRLDDARVLMRQTGLTVLDDGVPEGDPTGDGAIVRAQKPAAGTEVPIGSCIGFRTTT